MTKEERSLLMFLETRAVDYGGRVDTKFMNSGDMEIAKRWDVEGFVKFGRIASDYISPSGAYWCELSDDAWGIASRERRAKAERVFAKRNYLKTSEI